MVSLLALSVPRKTTGSLQAMLITSGSEEFIEELKRRRDAVTIIHPVLFLSRVSAAKRLKRSQTRSNSRRSRRYPSLLTSRSLCSTRNPLRANGACVFVCFVRQAACRSSARRSLCPALHTCLHGSCCSLHVARCVRQVPLLVSGTAVVHGEHGPGHVSVVCEDDPRGKPVHVRQPRPCDGLSAEYASGLTPCHVFAVECGRCEQCTAGPL